MKVFELSNVCSNTCPRRCHNAKVMSSIVADDDQNVMKFRLREFGDVWSGHVKSMYGRGNAGGRTGVEETLVLAFRFASEWPHLFKRPQTPLSQHICCCAMCSAVRRKILPVCRINGEHLFCFEEFLVSIPVHRRAAAMLPFSTEDLRMHTEMME